jgi:hypothetical protein
MKEQLSPKGLVNDLQRDWPQIRALLPELPLLLKSVVDRELNANKNIQPENSPHSSLGLKVAIVGVVYSLVCQHPSMLGAPIEWGGPWLAAVGIVMLVLKR